MTLAEATRLAVRTLTKALDTTHPSADKMEVAVLSFKPAAAVGAEKEVQQRALSAAELAALLAEVTAAGAGTGDL